MPYYIGDLTRDPNLENYPFIYNFRVQGSGGFSPSTGLEAEVSVCLCVVFHATVADINPA